MSKTTVEFEFSSPEKDVSFPFSYKLLGYGILSDALNYVTTLMLNPQFSDKGDEHLLKTIEKKNKDVSFLKISLLIFFNIMLIEIYTVILRFMAEELS
jgi:hypothetical protein